MSVASELIKYGPWNNVDKFEIEFVKSGITGYLNKAEIPVVSGGG